MNQSSPPPFVNEQDTINHILHWFIDQLDKQAFTERQNRLIFHIKKSSRHCKALYQFNNDADFIWSCIKQLSQQEQIFNIELHPKNSLDGTVYHNARLVFNPEQEALLRQWLERPSIDPYTAKWNLLLNAHSQEFENPEVLLDKPLLQDGWSIEQIIEGLIVIGKTLSTPMTLRKLSSQCFLSDSKFLDNRKALIEQLYPSLYPNIIHRPVIINCYLPERIKTILFIENQDTFLEYTKTRPTNTVVIYSAGFKASDKSIRQNKGVIFSLINTPETEQVLINLKQIWFQQTINEHKPEFYFWGDLDYAGLSILKSLREQFPTLTAWQTGYAPMLERLIKGQGHTAQQSKKARQKIPESTGCHYADTALLPALNKYQAFVDQEIYLADSGSSSNSAFKVTKI